MTRTTPKYLLTATALLAVACDPQDPQQLPPDAGTELSAVYGLRDSDRTVVALGDWPALDGGATVAFQAVAPEDRALGSDRLFLSGFLASDGRRLLTGYTRAGTGFPGSLALWDSAARGEARYVAAPGNLTASGHAGVFYVNALEVAGGGQAGTDVFALGEDATAKVVGTTGESDASGSTALARNGVGVFGWADSSWTTHLVALTPAQLTAARAGAPVSLPGRQELPGATEADGLETFGNGVAVLRGDYDASWSYVVADVQRVELGLSADGASVTVGTPATVLRVVDACTRVALAGSVDDDLLLRVQDAAGTRLVRVQQGGSGDAPAAGDAGAACPTGTGRALGTLVLEKGFSVAASVPLADGVSQVAVVKELR